MRSRRPINRMPRGLTLVELTVAMVASSVLLLAVTGVLAGNHKQWNQTYNRSLGQVVTEAYVTRQTFDRIVREASAYWCTPMYYTEPPSEMTLELYTGISNMGASLAKTDRYAKFYLSGTNLVLEQGGLYYSGSLHAYPVYTQESSQVLAHHVTIAKFWRSGPCIHMALFIDDGNVQMPITMTATRYNP